MTRVLPTVRFLVAVLMLAALTMAGASAARADDPNSGGDITVTIVDPSASPSPTSSTSPGSGSGTHSPGHGSGSGGGGSSTSSPAPGSGGSGGGSSGHHVPKWVVVSGFGGGSHSEFNPFRGWVHSTVRVVNHSSTDAVTGKLVFRLHSFLGGQLGPTVTREIKGLRPGKTSTTSVDLAGVGQWPLVKVSVAFQQSGAGKPGAIEREAWVVGSPWLLLVIAVLVVAILAIARIRRNLTVPVLQPEAAV